MSEESKDERFYEPRNWDRKMVIDEPQDDTHRYCGKCGHIIYKDDKFCTRCGAEARK